MTIYGNVLSSYLNHVAEKSPIQKKKIEKNFSKLTPEELAELEQLAIEYRDYLQYRGISLNDAIDSYLRFCNDIMNYQIFFFRHGNYPNKNSKLICSEIYENTEVMAYYNTAMALTQILWRTHFEIYKFFISYLKTGSSNIRSYLEIGCSHGLYTKAVLELLPDSIPVTVVDICKHSIDETKSVLNYFSNNVKNISFFKTDIFEFNTAHKYEFIELGEVLEHVENPALLLRKIHSLLTPDGKVFVSTCANAPAPDHIYLFRTTEEIRDMLTTNGFEIESEKVLPVEDLSMDKIIEKKITINYCAILKKI